MRQSRQEYVLTAKAIVGFAFALALFAASMYLSAAMGWELADFSDLRWWALVVVRIFLFATLVLDVYPYLYQMILTDDYGVTHNRINNFLECVAIIERDHRMADLDKAIQKRNNDEFRREANAMIHRVSRRINYEDVETEFAIKCEDGKVVDGWTAITMDQIHDIITNRCGINPDNAAGSKKRWKKRKLKKRYNELQTVFEDIKSGNVYVRELCADDIVSENFIDGIEKDVAGKNGKRERNWRIAFTMTRGAIAIFLSAAIIITSVVFDSAIFGVIMALAIILWAITSGISLAWTLATKIGYICEANTRLVRNYMGIEVNIPIPEKPAKKKKEKVKVEYANRDEYFDDEGDKIL